jgi:Anti-sigma-K factor rskA/Putative zinc-finger
VEHVDELIPAHALRTLDPDDERIVTEHLATCERCRLHLRDFEGVAAALAYASPAVQPPPELRDRVMSAVSPVVAPPQPQRAEVPPSRPRFAPPSWWPRVSLVAVPALGIAVLALAAWNISLHNRLSNRNVSAVTPIGNVGSAVAYKGGDTTLFARLPAASAGHVYEVWVIEGGGAKPLAAGVFSGGRIVFTLKHAAARGDTIAITLEPGHGGSAPTGPTVASGRLA